MEAVPPALEAVWKGYFTEKVPGTLVETLNKGLDVLEDGNLACTYKMGGPYVN